MAIVNFAPVERHAAHVIVTAYGESGCGKTYSLIRLGRGLVGPKGKLGMIDTETGRGKIYANVAGGYLYAELTPPFTPERYIEAIDAAEEAGIEALIIDSGSHEWEGIGGVIEIADEQRTKNGEPMQGLAKWARPKARHKKYVQRLLNSRMHLLISLRAKEKLVQLTNKDVLPKGARIGDIVSDGFVPIQDKRFIFETTVQLFLPIGDRARLGIPSVEKCPEDLWGAFPAGAHISEDTGRRIAEWVNGGTPIDREFDRLKRAAEEKASEGLAALREYWNRLPPAARHRLTPQIDNLTSIARTADEERERRAQTAHTSFGEVGGDPDRPADPFGLPPSEQASRDDRAERPRPAADADRAPAGGVESHRSTPAGEPATAQPGLALAEENLFVPPPPRNPTPAELDFYIRQIEALVAEGPRTPQRMARIRLKNEAGIRAVKAADMDRYSALMAVLQEDRG